MSINIGALHLGVEDKNLVRLLNERQLCTVGETVTINGEEFVLQSATLTQIMVMPSSIIFPLKRGECKDFGFKTDDDFLLFLFEQQEDKTPRAINTIHHVFTR